MRMKSTKKGEFEPAVKAHLMLYFNRLFRFTVTAKFSLDRSSNSKIVALFFTFTRACLSFVVNFCSR